MSQSRRRILALGGAVFAIAVLLSILYAIPTFAAKGTGGKGDRTMLLGPPQQKPTISPKTPDFGGLPPIDVGSLTGDETPTPTPAGEGEVNTVIQASFDECEPIEDEFILIECDDGELNFTRKETQGTRYIYYRPDLTDARIQVTTRLPSQKNARYGVIFRLDENFENYYVLGVTNEGQYGLFRFGDGKYHTIIPYTESFNVGNASFPSKLEIVNQGDVIAIKIGGEWIDSILDPNLASGRVALFVEPDVAGQTVLFDDLQVDEILSPLPVPEPRVVEPEASPTAEDSLPNIIEATPTPTTSGPRPTQTPFIIVVTATPTVTNTPTRAPTRKPTTSAANSRPAKGNEALFYIANAYPGTTMRFTIGGGEWGTHDFDVPGDDQYRFITMPPGKYTYTAFIPGFGTAHGEKTEYLGGRCYSVRFSPQ